MLTKRSLAFAIFSTLALSLFASLQSTGKPGRLTRAQYCNPATVSYLARDEKGNRLTEVELKSICDTLPKSIGDARLSPGEVSFADDGKTFYWPESTDWQKGGRVPCLHFVNNETCAMRLGEVTLAYNNKRMRLIFNIDITRTQPDRRLVVDSLPFQEGAFELDLKNWPREEDQMIPAERWKKVKDTNRFGNQ